MALPGEGEDEGRKFAERALQPWRLALLVTEKGVPKTCLANALTALRLHPEWSGILRFDAFQQRTMLAGKLPWCERTEERPWSNADDGLTADWLQRQGIMLGSKAVAEAVELVARDRQFHPVLDYLATLKWDGIARLDEWSIKYLGAEDTLFIRAVSCRWMISAIARVMQPGCKADCALILEGSQGIGKSQALRVLFQPWFADEIGDLGSKDAAIQIAGVWCMELAELVGMRRSDIDRVKAFMSRSFDRFRPPWGTRADDHQRQTVFAGTVNDGEYLRDETGGRRFWPLRCRKIDLDGLREARDQLFAEARDRYETGEVWWLNDNTLNTIAAAEQEQRRIADPWQEDIARYLVGKEDEGVLPSEYLRFLGMELVDQDQRDQNRVVACLKALGWERRSYRADGVVTPRKRYGPRKDV